MTSTERGRKHRERKAAAATASLRSMGSEQVGTALADAIAILKRSGLPCPSHAELEQEPPGDRARAIGSILVAAAKAMDLARKRGELVSGAEAQSAMVALGASVRQSLERMPAYLPASLSPDARDACIAAMRQAQAQAFAMLERA